MKSTLRKYTLTGLLVLIPLFLTGWVLLTLMRWTDRALRLIPPAYRPETLLGFNIPGLGLILTITIIVIMGALVANVAGRKFLSIGEGILRERENDLIHAASNPERGLDQRLRTA